MELKFRAWFKNNKVYIEPMTLQEMIHQKVNQFKLEQLNDWFIFEQYTGLKDKNGKEIYIGDIVKLVFVDDIEETIEVKSIFHFAQWTWDNVSTSEVIGNIHEKEEYRCKHLV